MRRLARQDRLREDASGAGKRRGGLRHHGRIVWLKGKVGQGLDLISPIPVPTGPTSRHVDLDWWIGLDGDVQTAFADRLRGPEDDILALAAIETEIGIACRTEDPYHEGEPAGMTVIPVTDADETLRRDAVQSVIPPAFAARRGLRGDVKPIDRGADGSRVRSISCWRRSR